MQRIITKNLPVDDKTLNNKFQFSLKQINAVKDIISKDIDEINSLEFGAGWDLLTPLSYYMLGLNDQTVVDLFKNMKPDLINNSIKRLNKQRMNFEDQYDIKLRELPNVEIKSFEDLSENFGIKYNAPIDMQETDSQESSFDYITSLSTLEHIPESSLQNILMECKRIISIDGKISFIVDLRDHYSYFDQNISIYNFLKFSDEKWKRYNHYLQFQNRLRVNDYQKFIEKVVLKISKFDMLEADEFERKSLEDLNIDIKYAKNTFEENSNKEIWMILGK